MSKADTTLALATFTSPELRADPTQLALLQSGVIQQLELMRRLRGEEAMRGLMVGLTLQRIKASLPHGQFVPWMKAHISLWSDRYCRYLMRLALAFVEKTKAKKPELLALPGEQIEMNLEGAEGARRTLLEKMARFVGDHSLADLFEKYGIKETKKLGGAREDEAEGDQPPAPAATPEQLAQAARDEIGTAVQALEQLLLRENRLQYVIDDETFLSGTVESLETLASKTADLVAQLRKPAAKAATRAA